MGQRRRTKSEFPTNANELYFTIFFLARAVEGNSTEILLNKRTYTSKLVRAIVNEAHRLWNPAEFFAVFVRCFGIDRAKYSIAFQSC